MLRLVQNDTCSRFFQLVRDGTGVPLIYVHARFRKPSGAVQDFEAVLDDGPNGGFRVDFGPAGLTLDELGEHWLDFEHAATEHAEEPLRVWVRPEFVRGPR